MPSECRPSAARVPPECRPSAIEIAISSPSRRHLRQWQVSHLRGYINKLRAGYDSMRTELDAKAASLEKAQALIRAIQDEPYDAAADPNSIGDPSWAVSRDPPPPVPAPPPM